MEWSDSGSMADTAEAAIRSTAIAALYFKDPEKLAEEAYKQAHPLNNICGVTPTYRKDLVKVYVKSAVQEAVRNATRGGGAA